MRKYLSNHRIIRPSIGPVPLHWHAMTVLRIMEYFVNLDKAQHGTLSGPCPSPGEGG